MRARDVEARGEAARGFLAEFATTDPRTLGLFRVLFGALLLVDLYRRVPDVALFYSNDGMLPNHGSIFRPMSAHLFSLYHAFGTPGEVRFAFALTAIVYLLYAVGYRTKLMQVLALLCVSSLHSRNIMLENGGDVVMNLLALWTVFLPLGRRFSVDALRRSLAERPESRPSDLAGPRPPADTRPVVSLAFAALVLNLVVIYHFNVVHKDGAPWRDLTAVHYVFWTDRLLEPTGLWLRLRAPLELYQALTVWALVLERGITILLVSPLWLRSCRRVAAFMVLVLHLGLESVGNYGLFAFAMMLHAVLLLGPEDWEALAARMRARLPSRTVLYDASCGVCFQLARVLARLDHLGKVSLRPSDDEAALPPGLDPAMTERTLVVVRPDGAYFTEAQAVRQTLVALPYGVVAAKVLELPLVSGLARRGYERFAARRREISVALGLGACGLPPVGGDVAREAPRRPEPLLGARATGALTTAAVAVMMLASASQIVAENRGLPWWVPRPASQPKVLAAIAQYPRMFQGWSMFAPVPPFEDGCLVVDGVTADGRHIDPLRDGGPVDFSLPPVERGFLVSQLWFELHDRMRRDVNARYRDHLRDYLFRWHELEGRQRDRLVSFELSWVSRPIQPPGIVRREPTRRQKLMEARAPGLDAR
ncbi:MAG: lipase maturation factor family protein [Polyangiaceae bacterium]|nr:lipase maturation factor family protein [Polyangiaceae bacterium]